MAVTRSSPLVNRLLSAHPLPHPSSPVRLGIVGSSGFAQATHLSSIEFLRGQGWPIEVSALCDLDPERLREGGLLFPRARRFSDSDAFFEQARIDAAMIITQPEVSLSLCHTALRHGKPFFVEKPAALSPAQLLALAETAEYRDVAAQVGYNRRFQPSAPMMKQFAAATPACEHVAARLWRADRSESFFYTDTLVHLLDLLLWLFGPLEVGAIKTTAPRTGSVLFSALEVTLHNQSGLELALDVRPAVGRSLESIEVTAPNASALLSYARPDGFPEAAEFATFTQGSRHTAWRLPAHVGHPTALNLARGFVAQIASFCHLVTSGRPSQGCSLREAATCLRLRDAILSGLETNTVQVSRG